MSSNPRIQNKTTKPDTNGNDNTSKRKKTRPNQRMRKKLGILKAQLREAEAASLEGNNTKKNHSQKSLNCFTTPKPCPSTLTEPSETTLLSSNLIEIIKKDDPISEQLIEHKIKSETAKNSNSLSNSLNNNLSQSNQLERKTIRIMNEMSANVTINKPPTAKTRDEIMAEREAKKFAKQMKKAKIVDTLAQSTQKEPQKTLTETQKNTTEPTSNMSITSAVEIAQQKVTSSIAHVERVDTLATVEKNRDQIKAEREAKKKAKQALKEPKACGVPEITAQIAVIKLTENSESTTQPQKKTALSKSERRAIQEAQRAAKAQALGKKISKAQEKSTTVSAKQTKHNTTSNKILNLSSNSATQSSPNKNDSPSKKYQYINNCGVRLFNHLDKAGRDVSLFVNNPHIHPSIARLGEQYAQRTVVGSNARCIGFLNALKMVIRDFETPAKKEFARSLETTITNSVDHLQKCRPLAVSVSNAYKHIKHVLTQLPTDKLESDLKENLCRFIDTYIENQIGKAAEAISYSVQEKISNGDVILTFGCSSLITYIFEEAQRRNVNFRVIIVDSRPFCEGQELLRRLTVKEIPCSYVLINAISFVMPEATKVLLGAHALLANGYVMSRTGTAQVALVAHSFNVPVLVCCETHKFSERSQTDAIVYNELGNPDDLIRSNKCSLVNWQTKGKIIPLNLMYDITPPELVTAVVTEVSILPCTSVPVILRIKPTEIGY